MEDAAGTESVGRRQRGCSFAPEEFGVPVHVITSLNFLCDGLCLSIKAGVMGRDRRWVKPQGRPEKLGVAGF